MTITTNVRNLTNAALKLANLQLDTLTAQKYEAARIRRLLERGHFARSVYPILPSIANVDVSPLCDAYAT